MDKIIESSRKRKNSSHLIDYVNLAKITFDYDIFDILKTRASFRNFSIDESNVNKESLDIILERIYNVASKILNDKIGILSINVLDNKGLLGKKKKIYRYTNGDGYLEQTLYKDISNKDNLFIQEEMHDASEVIFFMWDLSSVKSAIEEDTWLFKEAVMICGLLGNEASLYATKLGLKGTVFAGASTKECDYILRKKNNISAYAYAFE